MEPKMTAKDTIRRAIESFTKDCPDPAVAASLTEQGGQFGEEVIELLRNHQGVPTMIALTALTTVLAGIIMAEEKDAAGREKIAAFLSSLLLAIVRGDNPAAGLH